MKLNTPTKLGKVAIHRLFDHHIFSIDPSTRELCEFSEGGGHVPGYVMH